MRPTPRCLLLLCWATCVMSQSSDVTERPSSTTVLRTSQVSSAPSSRPSLFIPSTTSNVDSRPTFSRLNTASGNFPSSSPSSAPNDPKDSRRRTPLAPILFAILGGLIVLALLVALARFIALRKRAPKRDRAAEEMDKHRLYQEISEMQRNSLIGRPPNFEPPPVYHPPPPTYDAGTTSTLGGVAEDGYQGYAPGRDGPPMVIGGRPSWERRSSDNPTMPLIPGSNV